MILERLIKVDKAHVCTDDMQLRELELACRKLGQKRRDRLGRDSSGPELLAETRT